MLIKDIISLAFEYNDNNYIKIKNFLINIILLLLL